MYWLVSGFLIYACVIFSMFSGKNLWINKKNFLARNELFGSAENTSEIPDLAFPNEHTLSSTTTPASWTVYRAVTVTWEFREKNFPVELFRAWKLVWTGCGD